VLELVKLILDIQNRKVGFEREKILMNERCSLCRRTVPLRHFENFIKGVDDIVTVFDNVWHVFVTY